MCKRGENGRGENVSAGGKETGHARCYKNVTDAGGGGEKNT